jgi:hypothetical protein
MTVPEVPEYLPGNEDVSPELTAARLRDVVHLLGVLVRDGRVPWHAKAIAAAAVAYVAPGIRRLLPRPPLAAVTEPLVLMVAVRHLVAAAGYEVVRESWRGDDAGFVWLLVLSGIDA